MKNLTKLGIAGSLALGSVAAHASIAVPTSTNGYLGNVVLFADIFNGTTLVAAYAGDTGATVASVGAGTAPTTAFEDSNLSTFLSKAAGNTVVWAVEGGGINASQNPFLVTSSTSLGQLQNANNGSTLTSMGTALYDQINSINSTLGNVGSSLLGTIDNANGGTGFNPQALAADLSNWGGATANVAQTGLGSKATLYALTAGGQTGTNNSTTTAELTVSLTSNGLVYGTVTPLPAAVWLLGSGLLGLAGVGRRKNKAA